MAKRKKKHILAGFKVQTCMRTDSGEIVPMFTIAWDDDGNEIITHHVAKEQKEEWTDKMLDNISNKCNEIINNTPEHPIRQSMEAEGITSKKVTLAEILGVNV